MKTLSRKKFDILAVELQCDRIVAALLVAMAQVLLCASETQALHYAPIHTRISNLWIVILLLWLLPGFLFAIFGQLIRAAEVLWPSTQSSLDSKRGRQAETCRL